MAAVVAFAEVIQEEEAVVYNFAVAEVAKVTLEEVEADI